MKQSEYNSYIELKCECAIKETRIFKKIFTDENNDSDIKLSLSLFEIIKQ